MNIRIRKTMFAMAGGVAVSVGLAGVAQAQDIKIGYTADQSASGVAELGIAGAQLALARGRHQRSPLF